jgi:hypothetical protein
MDSRLRNIEEELRKQLEMQMGIEFVDPLDRLSDLGLVGTSSGVLARHIAVYFPFVSPEAAESLVARSETVRDLIYAINNKVGAA